MTTTPASPPRPVALEVTGVSRTFGAVRALDGVSLVVRQGTVHALLGENGAGKTTLMRLAFGLLAPDAGEVRLFGGPGPAHPRDAMRAGVGMVHQHLSLVPTFTAAENVVLGQRGLYRPEAAAAAVRRLGVESGLHVKPDALARDLTVAEQQRLEILKALARGARLLILDEPTTGLAPQEIEELLAWIRRFADNGGTVVLITHRLREALATADEITVLRRGVVAHRAAGSGARTSEQELARAIFPDAPDAEPGLALAPGEVVASLLAASVSDSRKRPRLRRATLEVRRGEILGIAGVEESGHRELIAVLAGLRPPDAGTATLPSRIAFIPSDRQREALIPEFDLVENVALRGAGARRGRMPWSVLEDDTAAIVERFRITTPSVRARARGLSGGNQQRLVIGRELAEPVDLVVADDPSRGLDTRATQFVHGQLRAAAAAGAGVVVHSSDLDEVLALAGRVVVVFHGDVNEVPAERDLVGRAMLGAR